MAIDEDKLEALTAYVMDAVDLAIEELPLEEVPEALEALQAEIGVRVEATADDLRRQAEI